MASELGMFSGISAPPTKKRDDYSVAKSHVSELTHARRQSFESKDSSMSGMESLLSQPLTHALNNVRSLSFSSRGSANSNGDAKPMKSLLDQPLPDSTTPDSKNTEQTILTTDSPSVLSEDVFQGIAEEENPVDISVLTQDNNDVAPPVADAASVTSRSSLKKSVSRKLEYDEETGEMISQPIALRTVVSRPVVPKHDEEKKDEDVEVELQPPVIPEGDDVDVEDKKKNDTPKKQDEPKEPPVDSTTKTPPPEPPKRSMVQLIIVGSFCLILGGILGAIITRNVDSNKSTNRDYPMIGNPNGGGQYDFDMDSSDEGYPTANPTVRKPTLPPTTAAPTIFVPTMRPTRTPTGVPTRKPTQAPTSPNQLLGRSDRLDRIKNTLGYGRGETCHPKADKWFLEMDTWGQMAWAPEVSAFNRDQLWLERYVVSCLYYRILASNTITEADGFGWLSSNHICEWDARTNETVAMNCTDDGEVSTFYVSQLAYVDGTFPSEIGGLRSLEMLGFLRPKNLIGTIPSELSNLPLKYFRCIQCSLSGTIPTQLGRLSMLTTLYLGDSFDKTRYLSGSIPSHIGRMTLLQQLSIKNARLTGSIPSEIINLWNLTEMYLTGNRLSGDIPRLPANLTDCELAGLAYEGDHPEENCFPNLDDTVCTHWSQNCKVFQP